MNNEINNELNEIEVNDAETSDIFEEEVNLTRSAVSYTHLEINVVYKRADGNYGVLEPTTD